MRELTQAEYRELFGTADRKFVRLVAEVWNEACPASPIRIVSRLRTGDAIVYREQLPAALEKRLAELEAAGRVFIEGIWEDVPRARVS